MKEKAHESAQKATEREESRAIHTFFFSARESAVSLELLVGESLTLTVTENLEKFVTL